MKIILLSILLIGLGGYNARATTICAGPFGQSQFGSSTEQGSGSSATPNGQLTFLGDSLTFLGDNLTYTGN